MPRTAQLNLIKKKTPWEHEFPLSHAYFFQGLKNCSKDNELIAEYVLWPWYSATLNKETHRSPPSPQGFFMAIPVISHGNQEPQALNEQRTGLRKGSLWIPDGNSRWGNPGVVRSAKFLWLGATMTILTSHLSTSVSTSQVTSCSEYPRVSLPWYPGQWRDTVKSHLPTWQNREKAKVKQGLWEKGEQGQGHRPLCHPTLLSKASLETIS